MPSNTACRRPERWPATLHALAPGPGTAAALAATGIRDVTIPATTFDSEGLLALPAFAQPAGKRVVIFRGEGGRDVLGDTLRARGATVEYVDCYRRAAPQSGAGGLAEALRDGRAHALTFTSSEGIDNLWALLDADARARMQRLPAFVPHPRIADARAQPGPHGRRDRGRGRGPRRRIARMVRFAPTPRTLNAMAQPDIIVTAPLPPFLYDPLKADYRCHDYYAASHKPGLLAAEGARIRGLVQGGGTVTPASLLDALPRLEIISVFGVGYDGVPVDYCRQRGIKVTNTPDVLTDDVADVAVALVMMTGRGFVRLNRFVHAGEWEKRGPELTTKLSGKRVGILGLGRIGKAIAERVRALGMQVSYTGRKPQDVPYRFVPDLEGLAAESDFLVVACPGGAATKNIVNADVLAALGKKGTLVNIARGSIVDEPALVAALQAGTIKGAGLDVFADEPHIPAPLMAMDNVVLLPHVGSATHETRKAMGDLCKANLDAWFGTGKVLTLIPELG